MSLVWLYRLRRAVCGGDCVRIRGRRLFVGRMEMGGSMEAMALEADAEQILNTITPNLDSTKHKGQAGRVAVIGGCREYTGAPYFAAISALRIGADLSHVFCTKDAATVIKGYSPELIVHPLLEESYNIKAGDKESTASKILAESQKWMERFDCLVVGPGLGRDPFILECVGDILSEAKRLSIPVVIDGDGLFLVTNRIDLVDGYHLAVLTPNVNEYKRLVARVLNSEVDDRGAASQLLSLSKQLGGVTVLKKGETDLISDGRIVTKVSSFGSPRRCGGQGDVLSGSVAVFSSWARARQREVCTESSESNPLLLGCVSGSVLVRKAASMAFTVHHRATVTGDIISFLGKSMKAICPVNPALVI